MQCAPLSRSTTACSPPRSGGPCERGLTLGQLVEEALRADLAAAPVAERLDIPVFTGGDGVRPGIDTTSNRALLEALDEDRALEQLR